MASTTSILGKNVVLGVFRVFPVSRRSSHFPLAVNAALKLDLVLATMQICRALTLIAALSITSCASSPTSYSASESKTVLGAALVLKALDIAESKWSKLGPENYSFNICSGGVFGCSVYYVRVQKTRCSKTFKRMVGIGSTISCDEATMPSLFAAIRKEAGNANDRIEVSFDKKLGYLEHFSVEPHTDLTDQGWHVEITKFRIGR